jgi:putative hemolysin
MEFIFILFLILLNGFFAMAEIAIVASRKSKLAQMIAEGSKSAETALELARNPDKFFPTIQIGITLISILAGAIGVATLTMPFSEIIKQIPIVGPYHDILSFLLVIGGITYISLIIGELVPKHVAISNPEGIAVFVAPFMQALLKIALPLVGLLSLSSEAVLKLLRVKQFPASSISGDEVKLLMSEGTRAGIFNIIEKRLVSRVLHLDRLRVDSLMTPREAIQWFDINKLPGDFKAYLIGHKHSRIILCDKTIDNLIGVIHVKDFLRSYINDPKMDIKKYSQKPHLVPENTSAIQALELFRKSPMHMALIVDEYGAVRGLVTFNDVLEAVVGDIQEKNWINKLKITKRSDNSFLLDGMLMLKELKNVLKLETLPKEAYKHLTLGGFVAARLNKIPTESDKFEWAGYEFEVVDMDGNRVDKVLVTLISKGSESN